MGVEQKATESGQDKDGTGTGLRWVQDGIGRVSG